MNTAKSLLCVCLLSFLFFAAGCGEGEVTSSYQCVENCAEPCGYDKIEMVSFEAVDGRRVLQAEIMDRPWGYLEEDQSFELRSDLSSCSGSMEGGRLNLKCAFTDFCHGLCGHPSTILICQDAVFEFPSANSGREVNLEGKDDGIPLEELGRD